uniref:Uncharacterized protein n=1 Tax=Helianthus annuus TaxID=4232 RepID=A0A251VHR2_HELAN
MSFDLSNQPIDLILLQKINHVPGDLFRRGCGRWPGWGAIVCQLGWVAPPQPPALVSVDKIHHVV